MKSPVDDAWQGALAAEHRAVFGYALLGPRLAGSDQAFAIACSDAHESLRDAAQNSLAAAHLDPVSPEADYPDLYPVTTEASARTLAVRLEDGCAAAWRFLYAAAATQPGSDPRRAEAQTALTASALRATRWRAVIDPARATDPFPGI